MSTVQIELLSGLVADFAEGIEEFILLLERYMAGLVPLVDELLCLAGGIFDSAVDKFAQLLDDVALLGKIVGLLLVLVAQHLLLVVKEGVACCVESLPESLRGLVGGGTDLFPLLLELDELVGSLGPFGTVLEGFGFFAELCLECGILGKELALGFEELGLLVEEVVTSSAVALVDLVVHLLGSAADALPFGLELDNLLCNLVPCGEVLEVVGLNVLYLLTEFGLLFQVFLLDGLELLEVLRMALIDSGRGGFESVPKIFPQFLGHRPYLAKFLMELLEDT